MRANENKEILRPIFSERGKVNAAAFLDAMYDNLKFTLIGNTKFSGVFNGKKEFTDKVLASLGAALDGGLVITPDNLIADGEYVAMQSRGKSTAKNGKSYNNTYCHVFRITNGKISAVTEYLYTELVNNVFGK